MNAGHWLFFLYICKWADWWYAPWYVFLLLWFVFIWAIFRLIVKYTLEIRS